MELKHFGKVKEIEEIRREKGRNKRNKGLKRKTQLQSDHNLFRSKFKILTLFLMFH